MGDSKGRELLMPENARRTAGAAARLSGRRFAETVAAKGGFGAHGSLLRQIALPHLAESVAGASHFGRIDPGAVGKCDQQILIGEHMLEHASKKVRLPGGIADRLRGDAGRRNKAAKAVLVLGYESKRLNRQHFGVFIRIRSRLWHRLYLPLLKKSGLALPLALAPAVILSAAELAPPEPLRKPGMAKTVLIVEDNELNMKLFHDLLEAHGYATLGTRNGIEALELARKHHPDLILMDIQLPEVSGLEVTKWLKEDPELQTIPVVAVTAFAMKGDEERIREGGCEAYLSKPISVGKFIETIRHFLGTA